MEIGAGKVGGEVSPGEPSAPKAFPEPTILALDSTACS